MEMNSRWSESWNQYDRDKVQPNEVIVTDVRLQSNAGWYIGALEFYDFEEMDFYSRDSDYYPNEALLKKEYPRSISVQEACDKVKHDRLYQRKMEKKLGINQTR